MHLILNLFDIPRPTEMDKREINSNTEIKSAVMKRKYPDYEEGAVQATENAFQFRFVSFSLI